MTTATKVADGQATAVAQYNTVIDELETHPHDGNYGIVQHSTLSDGVISGTYLSHQDLVKHLEGAADTVGGDEGIHGLKDDCYPVGSLTSYLIIDQGTSITTSKTGTDQTVDINFNLEFASAPKVFVICTANEAAKASVVSVTVRGCTVHLGFFTEGKTQLQSAESFSWIAIGVRA